jgi:integrase
MARRQRRLRGHIEERPNGTFRAIVYAGIDPLTKKPRYLKKTVPTEAQAQVELTRMQNQVDEQRHPRSSISIGGVIAKWLEVVELEDSTRERYDGLIRLYIAPTFGDLPAAKLDAELLERFYARLRRCNRLCGGNSIDHDCRPLSASTVRQVHFILRAALDRAVRWRYLGTNEAAFAEPPAFEPADPDPPSAEEVSVLLNEAWQDPAWGLFLWLVMVTGCRRGEMCALRWTDLDLVRGTMTVERSYSRTRSRAREKSTKTNQKRRLSLDAGTVDLLSAYHEQCRHQCKALDITLARDAFIFSGEPDFSTPLLPDTATQRYRRLAKRLGLRSTRLHALRHYSATELLMAGVDLRTVAGRLGHGSGGATTLRFYAAWVDEADRHAADAIASAMPRPNPGRRELLRNPYEMLAAKLRAAIESGQLPTGESLPTVVELAAEHEVSAGTVNRAFDLLKAEGLIDLQRGKHAIVTTEERPSL